MEQKEVKSLISYHHKSNKCKKEKALREDLSRFDIVYVPTQGGIHYCVIYDILPNETAVCYPITTASEHELMILGNSSWILRDCGEKKFNGKRLSSHATIVNLSEACYFKCSHLRNHSEIDRAILYFEKILERNDYRLGIVVKVEQDIARIATSFSDSPIFSKAYYYETLKMGDLVYCLSKRGRAFPLHTTERSLRTGFHTGTIVKVYPKRFIVISDIDGKRYAAKKDEIDYHYKGKVDFFPTLLYDSGNRCNKAFALGQL